MLLICDMHFNQVNSIMKGLMGLKDGLSGLFRTFILGLPVRQ